MYADADEIKAAICERIADGESLRQIIADEGMPASSTVFKWLNEDAQFSEQYARAREAQADALFDDLLGIADDGSNDWMERKNADGQNIGWQENGEALRRSALRIDARKWMIAKLQPKKYGEKVTQEHTGAVSVAHHGEIAVSGTAAFIADALGRGETATPEEPGQD
jgi:hypothetical protein